MVLRIYNTLSGEREEFKPIDEGKVRMYVCGQTVYDYMHIGHGKTYIAFDIIRRYLEYRGYDVELVINITDVNDKIYDRAREEDEDYWDVAEKYARINVEDFEELGVKADVLPRASDYVEEMIEVVVGLIDKGYAYEVDGDVFFDVREFDDYGKLSNQKLEDISGERDDIIASKKKKNPEDFVLWRKKDVEPGWESPWGKGWPGWHIECSTMATTLLGDTLDIHGGGVDLVFPHHEDEIAQSEAYSDEKFANYWMHSGLVRMKEDKMSKSIGNIVSTRRLLEDYEPEVLRLMVASSHYRKEMDFSEEKLEENKEKLRRLRNTVSDLERGMREADEVPEKYGSEDRETLEKIIEHKKKFEDAMDDDFNSPGALKQLFNLSGTLQSYLERDEPKKPILERGLTTIRKLGDIFGILGKRGEGFGEQDRKFIDSLVGIRDELREEGEYELADEIRSKLKERGIQLEDEGGETSWKRTN